MAAVRDVAAAIGVDFVPLRIQGIHLSGGPGSADGALALDPTQANRFVKLGVVTGDISAIDDDGAAHVSAPSPTSTRLQAWLWCWRFASTTRRSARTHGEGDLPRNGCWMRIGLLISHDLYDQVGTRIPVDFYSLAILRSGVPPAPSNTTRSRRPSRDYPTASVGTTRVVQGEPAAPGSTRGSRSSTGCSHSPIIIALIGIVNTLALSVHERTP